MPSLSPLTHRSAFAMLVLALLALSTARSGQAQGSRADSVAVRQAVLDYVEGFYEGDTTRLRRSVWPGVMKYGYQMPRRAGEPYRGVALRFPDEFMSLANDFREGRFRTPPNAPKDITIFEVREQIASAKVVAWWGVDYLLLARENGRWMITHVVWQESPRR